MVRCIPRWPGRDVASAGARVAIMAVDPDPNHPIERPGPADISDIAIIREVRKAAVWIGMALLAAGVIVLSQPILLIIGGMVFAVVLDGGTRLLGRILPI